MSLTDGSGGENGIAVVSCVEVKFWAPHAIDAMRLLDGVEFHAIDAT